MLERWAKPAGRALLMGVAWAGVWLLPSMAVGSMLVGELEPEHIGGAIFAGLPCGVIFSVVSGHASRHRRWQELSLARALAYGAVSGALVVVFLFLVGDQSGHPDPVWALPVFLLCSLSAVCAVTAAIFRWASSNGSPVTRTRDRANGTSRGTV